MPYRHLSWLPLCIVLGCGTATPQSELRREPSPPQLKAVSLADVGLDAAAMDRSADPCEDFYQFSCGGWLEKTEIPDDKPRWIRSFSEIHKRNEKDLQDILTKARKASSTDPAIKQLGAYFGACMNEEAIEAAGLNALSPLLDRLSGSYPKAKSPWPRQRWLADTIAKLHQHGIWAFFDIDSGQDFGDATQMIAHVDQNGLGLPDRDYYLKDDEKSKKLREAYVAHIERMMTLAGSKADAKAIAQSVMEIETALAKISKTRVERRDPKGIYNKIDRAGLLEQTAGFDWNHYLSVMGLGEAQDISVTSIPYMKGMTKILFELDDLKRRHYLQWHLIHSLAPSLPTTFVDENFKLVQALTGQKEQRPRWKRCVASTDSALGELIGQPFVKKRFSAESKQAVIGMVSEISKAFGIEIGKLSWMDAPTRERALEKLKTMAYLIGYPDKWRVYNFEIDPQSYARNVLEARRFDIAYELAKIGKPVDRADWFISPPTVNAFYNPLKNQMVFPAGILQPPFFNPKAHVPVNMGAMGMVVGHEITHGFDDKGSEFDKDGNLKSWWEPAVREQFDAKTKCIDEQYAEYEALPGLKLNGKLTLGENIADAGGVKLAFYGYRLMRQNATELLVAEGLSEDQQFFVSLGQIWCSKYREAYARLRAQTDTHSPPNWRVNGSLQNLSEFSTAFSCREGSGMHPTHSCQVW